ncbi:hypothetical protein C8J56DRAFT_458977 [Mycena floridula]|nr:hypothetical protein C8J56DRAFT_458977 [Mycena floridula]
MAEFLAISNSLQRIAGFFLTSSSIYPRCFAHPSYPIDSLLTVYLGRCAVPVRPVILSGRIVSKVHSSALDGPTKVQFTPFLSYLWADSWSKSFSLIVMASRRSRTQPINRPHDNCNLPPTMNSTAQTAKSTTAQPQAAVQMNVMSPAAADKQVPCEHQTKASRIRGGGAGKDCFIGLFACFLCFECCEVP